jgi:hypothetical protein
MNVQRLLFLCWVLVPGLCGLDAQDDQKLLGTWQTTIEDQTHTLNITESQLILNGEIHYYTLSEGNIVVDYQHYPYAFREGDLFVTVDGIEHKLTRKQEAVPEDDVTKALMGNWEIRDEYGGHRLIFLSGSQAEYDGERVAFTIRDDAFVVDYEKYPFKLEGETLMIRWPGESSYRTFSRVKD